MNFCKVKVIILKNKATILLFIFAMAGIALGVFFLIFGLKLDSSTMEMSSSTIKISQSAFDDGEVFLEVPDRMMASQDSAHAATMVSKTIYICTGSIFAFVSTTVAGLTVAKMAKEEEENQPK